MFFNRESNIKNLSLLLSMVFFFNSAWAQLIPKSSVPSTTRSSSPSPSMLNTSVKSKLSAAKVQSQDETFSISANQRLQLEENIKNFTKLWNQSSTLSQAIDQFGVSKEDQSFLHQVLKKEKIEAQKPVPVEYSPPTSKIVFNFAEEKKTLWVLSMSPSLVLYDRAEVLVFHNQSPIRDFFPQYKDQFKTLPLQKKKNKSKTSWNLFWIPSAYAQTTTTTATTPSAPTIPKTFYELQNEQIAKQQEALKKVAKKQKKFTQSLLLFIGLGAGISLFAMTATAGFNAVKRHWGSDSYSTLQNDIDKLKPIYPEIDNNIFNGGAIEINSFRCDTILNKNAPVRKVRYKKRLRDDGEEKSKIEVDLDLLDTPSMKEDLIKGEDKELAQKIQTLDRCCQNIPCAKWLSERLKANQQIIGEGESIKPFEEVNQFIEGKEAEAKKSIGTK